MSYKKSPEHRMNLHRSMCAVCNHAEREEVDSELRGGTTQTAVMERWGFSRDSVRHHIKAMKLFETNLADKKDILGRAIWLLASHIENTVKELNPKDAVALMVKSAELLSKIDGDLVSRSQALPPDFKGRTEEELEGFVASGGIWPVESVESDADGVDTTVQ